MRDGDNYGVLPGHMHLNDSFDRQTLESAMVFGAPPDPALGVVHVASHFFIGESERDSFLLLGNGARLTVEDFRKGIGKGEFDLGSVDLLTLSACNTAYASDTADGRELESLAKITEAAGARAVLASLWSISDVSTAIFMQRFYEIVAQTGVDRATALADVMREFIANRIGGNDADKSIVAETARRGMLVDVNGAFDGYSRPFHWAPFVLLEGH